MKVCPTCREPLFTHLDTITHDEMHARRGGVPPRKRGDGRVKAPPASVRPGATVSVLSVTSVTRPVTNVTHVTDYQCPGCRCRKYTSNAARQRAYRERSKRID